MMAIQKSTERNSERRMVWAGIALIGAHLLGIDLQQLLALALDAQKYILDLQQQYRSAGIDLDAITLPALIGLYTWCRTQIKRQREGSALSAIAEPPVDEVRSDAHAAG